MSHVKSARELQAHSIIKNLEKRNMTAFYCEDAESCKAKVLELIGKGNVISWGGSMSIHECGIPQALKDRGDCEVLDRSEYITPEQQQEFAVKTFQCDYYLMSTNAITLDGELVNIDGEEQLSEVEDDDLLDKLAEIFETRYAQAEEGDED